MAEKSTPNLRLCPNLGFLQGRAHFCFWQGPVGPLARHGIAASLRAKMGIKVSNCHASYSRQYGLVNLFCPHCGFQCGQNKFGNCLISGDRGAPCGHSWKTTAKNRDAPGQADKTNGFLGT
jgi:hypothetical protein